MGLGHRASQCGHVVRVYICFISFISKHHFKSNNILINENRNFLQELSLFLFLKRTQRLIKFIFENIIVYILNDNLQVTLCSLFYILYTPLLGISFVTKKMIISVDKCTKIIRHKLCLRVHCLTLIIYK